MYLAVGVLLLLVWTLPQVHSSRTMLSKTGYWDMHRRLLLQLLLGGAERAKLHRQAN
jgi:hypothetical protein